MTMQKIADGITLWIEDRAARPTAVAASEALAFMLATLRGETFTPPKRWETAAAGREEQRTAEQNKRMTFEDAATAYREYIKNLADRDQATHDDESFDAEIARHAALANHAAASVPWPMPKMKLNVERAIFPKRNPHLQDSAAQTCLTLTVADGDLKDSTQVWMRLSTILTLLPHVPGSAYNPGDVQTALNHVAKLRLDEELERCYDALERNIEYYHPANGGRVRLLDVQSPDGLSTFHDGYRTVGNPAPERWHRYNQQVRRHRYDCMHLGELEQLDELLPESHPGLVTARKLYSEPMGDKSLKGAAGEHYHKLLMENLELLTTVALGHVDAVNAAATNAELDAA